MLRSCTAAKLTSRQACKLSPAHKPTVSVAVMHAVGYSTGNVPNQDPIHSLVRTFPSGCLLLRDSLAASAQFLLPWLTAASLQQGDHVSMTVLRVFCASCTSQLPAMPLLAADTLQEQPLCIKGGNRTSGTRQHSQFSNDFAALLTQPQHMPAALPLMYCCWSGAAGGVCGSCTFPCPAAGSTEEDRSTRGVIVSSKQWQQQQQCPWQQSGSHSFPDSSCNSWQQQLAQLNAPAAASVPASGSNC